ncbi:hypothetical protein [Methanomethylophilus alvi]|uniref:hypothetical protein n=1 Tax=Methanomethylophilus alvi TaxID=1291540 RepID=UPI0037DC48EB
MGRVAEIWKNVKDSETVYRISDVWKKLRRSDTDRNMKVDFVLVFIMILGYAGVLMYFGLEWLAGILT